MHFSEDDLRNELRRKDPGPGFTQRVMARVGRAKEGQASLPAQERKRPNPPGWAWKLAPAWITAAAATVLAIGGGLGYWRYEQLQSRREAELAKRQVMQALKIANTKLNHVLKRVNESISEPATQEPQIRRQNL